MKTQKRPQNQGRFWGMINNIMSSLFQQSFWQCRHGTILSADEGRDFDGLLVSLGYLLAVENGSTEGTCEGVAGADGIGHLYLRSLLE